jgi:hypothetical protein
MTKTKRSDIANLIELVRVAYPNYRPEQGTAEIFFRLLEDLSKELLEAATIACLTEPGRAFAPSVGEIRGKAGELATRVMRIPSASEAYLEVLAMPANRERHTAKRQEPDGTWVVEVRQLKFSNPLVELVARDLGWPRLFPGENASVDRAQFTRAYEAALKQLIGQSIEHPALAGFVAQNAPQLPASDESQYEVVRRVSWKNDENEQTPPA